MTSRVSVDFVQAHKNLNNVAEKVEQLVENYEVVIENSRLRARMLTKIMDHLVENVDQIEHDLWCLFNHTDMTEDEIACEIAGHLTLRK